MATLTIRDVPESLHTRLKALAEEDHRSLSAEAITMLERAVQSHDARQEHLAALAAITARREARQPASHDSLTLLREDRDR